MNKRNAVEGVLGKRDIVSKFVANIKISEDIH